MGLDGIEVIVGIVEIGDWVGCMGVIVDFCDRRRRVVEIKKRMKKMIEPMDSHFAAFPCRFKSFSRKVGLLRSFSLGDGNSFSCGGGESCCIELSFHVVKFLSMISFIDIDK